MEVTGKTSNRAGAIRHVGANPKRGALGLIAITMSCATLLMVLGIALGDRYRLRIDLSVPGGSLLAARSKAVLDRLDGDHRLLVAADLSTTPREDITKLTDTLDEMQARNGRFDYTVIDVSGAAGVGTYQRAIEGLVASDAVTLRDQSAAIGLAAAGAQGLSAFLNEVASPKLLELESAVSPGTAAGKANRDYFNQTAAQMRLAARSLSEGAAAASKELKSTIGPVALPRTDAAKAALVGTFENAVSQLSASITQLEAYAKMGVQAGGWEDAKRLSGILGGRRDQAAVLLDSIRQMQRPDVLRVADGLAAGSGAILVGTQGRGLVALDLEALLPTGLKGELNVSADQGKRIEEAVVGGLLTLRSDARPIVVLVHGEMRAFVHEEVGVVGLARRRLEARGIGFVEWPCVIAAERPRIGELDAEGKRPVVYLVMSADSTADSGRRDAAQPGRGAGGMSGIERNQKIGNAVKALIAAGENVCVSLNPSIVATYGDADPIAQALLEVGIGVESGRPLLREQLVGGVRGVTTDFVLQPTPQSGAVGALNEDAIAAAVAGLPITIPWPLIMREVAGREARVRTILRIEASSSSWLESQWLSLWQTPRDRRAQLSDYPKFDLGRDSREGGEIGGWPVAMQSERKHPGNVARTGRQRVVAVGSNSWFIDAVAGRWAVIDGRRVALSPGNLELLDAVVSYLAGQDEFIAQSAAASAAPMVGPIADGKLGRIRLAVVAGLPALALLAGAALAVLRR